MIIVGYLSQIGGIDVTVNRNTYGRQNESFEASLMLTNAELKGNNGINGNSKFII